MLLLLRPLLIILLLHRIRLLPPILRLIDVVEIASQHVLTTENWFPNLNHTPLSGETLMKMRKKKN
jgi:hypothetical protein